MQWYSRAGLILCFVLAVLLHLAISVIFLYTLHHRREIAGTSYAKLIHTYLYPLDVLDRHLRGSNTKLIHVLHKHTDPSDQVHALSVLPDRSGKAITHKLDHKVTITQSKKSQIKGGGQLTQQGDSALLVLLHNQIQQHNHYPEQAMQLEQTGNVVLRFYVMPQERLHNFVLLNPVA